MRKSLAILLFAVILGGAAGLTLFHYVRTRQPSVAVLRHAVLDRLPEVEYGTPVAPTSLLLSLDEHGKLYRNGEPIELSRIEELRQPAEGGESRENFDPVLLEVHPSLTVSDIVGLLLRVHGVNVAFLVRTPEGLSGLTLPIPTCHNCRALQFYDGTYTYDEHQTGAKEHAWIEAHAGAGGTLLVERFRIGWEHQAEPVIVDPDAPETPPVEPRAEDARAPEPCDLPALAEFMDAPRASGISCFVQLRVEKKDRIEDVLKCLASVKKAVGNRVIVYFNFPAPVTGGAGSDWWYK